MQYKKSKQELEYVKACIDEMTNFVRNEIDKNHKIIQTCSPEFHYDFDGVVEKVKVKNVMYRIDENSYVKMCSCDFYKYLIKLMQKLFAKLESYTKKVERIRKSVEKQRNNKDTGK